jgi:hypothetical protein
MEKSFQKDYISPSKKPFGPNTALDLPSISGLIITGLRIETHTRLDFEPKSFFRNQLFSR